ncbi:MAG: TRAP transporter small permease [bacterium]
MNTVATDSKIDIKRAIVKFPLETVLCVLIVALVGVTFTQVLFRYIFHLSLAWSEELARFLIMWFASLCAAYAFKTKAHFALRFLVGRLGKNLQKAVSTFVMVILVAFLMIFIMKAIEYTISVSSRIAPGTGLSMAVPFSSAVVGGILMLYYIIRNWWNDFQGQTETVKNE